VQVEGPTMPWGRRGGSLVLWSSAPKLAGRSSWEDRSTKCVGGHSSVLRAAHGLDELPWAGGGNGAATPAPVVIKEIGSGQVEEEPAKMKGF